jgi:sigma-B regulation protein RsbU (phosphoserine phosphatase)
MMGERARILIVDDEPFNIEYLEQELEDHDYVTINAENGWVALERVSAEAPDLILLDILMPEMDGFEVLDRLKGDKDMRGIPVIVISALDDMDSVVHGIEHGAEDYLPKPFDPVLLHARIRSSLEKKRLRDQEQLYLKALERELEIGREIQAEFLPSELPQPPGWDIAAFFQAAREVAGDFYDAFTLAQDGMIGLLVGDVCDKGVGAALYMTLFRTLLRAVAGLDEFTNKLGADATPTENPLVHHSDRLKNAISLTNNYVAETHHQACRFASIFFSALDPVTGSLIYINAGHEPPIIFNADRVKSQLTPTGPVVGAFPEVDFTVSIAQLEPGDTLFMFTDGVTEAQSTSGDLFGPERLLELLEYPWETTKALLDHIAAVLQEHQGDAGQYDDIAMLAVRRIL